MVGHLTTRFVRYSCPVATRYRPDLAFPWYRFLPGRSPHPTRDPAGHSWQPRAPVPVIALPADRWRENSAYLWGVDLYNAGYFWEAHEAWEGLWTALPESDLQRTFLQGLIQCAAACVKHALGEPASVAKLIARGAERLERVAAETSGRYMGLDPAEVSRRFRTFAAGGADAAEPVLDLV